MNNTETCPRCGGKGNLPKYGVCPLCKGSGVINRHLSNRTPELIYYQFGEDDCILRRYYISCSCEYEPLGEAILHVNSHDWAKKIWAVLGMWSVDEYTEDEAGNWDLVEQIELNAINKLKALKAEKGSQYVANLVNSEFEIAKQRPNYLDMDIMKRINVEAVEEYCEWMNEWEDKTDEYAEVSEEEQIRRWELERKRDDEQERAEFYERHQWEIEGWDD